MARTLIAIAVSVLMQILLASTALAGVRQIGAQSTDPTDQFNIGAQTIFASPPLPQARVDDGHQFYWVGEFLGDGMFYQVGLAVNYLQCGSSCVSYFVQGFDAAGNQVLAWPPVCCFGSAGIHTYDLQRADQLPDGHWRWVARFDGQGFQNTDLFSFAADSSTNKPAAISEIAGGGVAGLPDLSDDLGPTTFSPALKTRFPGTGFLDTNSAIVRAVNAPCPPYNAFSSGFNSVVSGKPGGACNPDGTALW